MPSGYATCYATNVCFSFRVTALLKIYYLGISFFQIMIIKSPYFVVIKLKFIISLSKILTDHRNFKENYFMQKYCKNLKPSRIGQYTFNLIGSKINKSSIDIYLENSYVKKRYIYLKS